MLSQHDNYKPDKCREPLESYSQPHKAYLLELCSCGYRNIPATKTARISVPWELQQNSSCYNFQNKLLTSFAWKQWMKHSERSICSPCHASTHTHTYTHSPSCKHTHICTHPLMQTHRHTQTWTHSARPESQKESNWDSQLLIYAGKAKWPN